MAERGARVALVHGEVEKRAALAAKLAERLRAEAWQPLLGDRAVLRRRGTAVSLESRRRGRLAAR
jgi:hypothetical protein